MLKDILLNSSAYKILGFLTLHRDASFYDKEVSENTGLSRGITNRLLNRLLEVGVVRRERRGRMWFYSLNESPLMNAFRSYENLVMLQELVAALRPITQRIVLFGSTATGSDGADSDIDLFILSEQKNKVLARIRDYKTGREIKPVVQTPMEYAVARTKDKTFYDQVESGLKLHEEAACESRL